MLTFCKDKSTMVISKAAIRERIWTLMERRGVVRFPGAQGRIPNFVGAERAAAQLPSIEAWRKAKVIKCNPDSPQRPVRELALREGKKIYMAVPRLRQQKCFIELDPAHLRGRLREASTIRGAFVRGRPVAMKEMDAVDLIVAGSVAVTPTGARVGKGGGYSDLEYAIAKEMGLITENTPVLTTVHPLQIVTEEIDIRIHDISVDIIVTPEGVIYAQSTYRKPEGIYWDILRAEMLDSIPVLNKLRQVVD